MSGDPTHAKLETFGYANAYEQFPELPETGSMVLIQITSLITPVHFNVRFPYGTVNFGDILKGLYFSTPIFNLLNIYFDLLYFKSNNNKYFLTNTSF